MEKISRSHALKSGLNKYYTGRPCKHGHYAERYVTSCSCITCLYGHIAIQREGVAIAKRQWKKMQEILSESSL